MDGRSILWILAFSVVLIQARQLNPNVFRRNMNANMNMNTNSLEPRVRRPSRRPMYDDDIDFISPLAKYPSSHSPGGGPVRVAALATAAADAALAITKTLAQDMSHSAAIAVAEAVARILNKRYRRPGSGRRSSNINSNYNFNLVGPPSLIDPEEPQLYAENDLLQAPASADFIQDPTASVDSRYVLLPSRAPGRTRLVEPHFSGQDWDSDRDDMGRMLNCRYKPSSCGMRRRRPPIRMELMDDHASAPKEEATTSGMILAEAEGADNDKESLNDRVEAIFLDKEKLVPELNVTTTVEPSPIRRSRNKNTNRNKNINNYRRLNIIRGPQRRSHYDRPPPIYTTTNRYYS